MNSPRNPYPTPDPDFVLSYITHVLGIELSDWQQEILLGVITGYGYASAEAAVRLEASARATARGDKQPPFEAQRPYGPTQVPAPQHSATPIGDTVGPDPRKS